MCCIMIKCWRNWHTKYCQHFSPAPAAAVSLEQEQHAVNESENVVEVCVIAEGFGVAVNLSTLSLTAQGTY